MAYSTRPRLELLFALPSATSSGAAQTEHAHLTADLGTRLN